MSQEIGQFPRTHQPARPPTTDRSGTPVRPGTPIPPGTHGRRAKAPTARRSALPAQFSGGLGTGAWADLAVAVLALPVFAWAVGAPSLWRDEAATLSMTRRSLGDLTAALAHVDLVHGLYYLLAHLTQLVSPTLTSARLLSVVAFAGVAGLTLRLGRLLGSPAIGVTAAALVVASPLASRYAQDARPFALVTLAATWSTCALLAAVRIPMSRARAQRAWATYAASVVVLGLLNVLALLLLLAHASVLAVLALQSGRYSLLRRWAIRTTTSLVLLMPFVAATWTQRGQVSWIPVPHVYDLTGFYVELYGSRLAVLLAGAGALAVIAIAAVRRVALPARPATTALVLGAVWAAVPPVVLWTVSQVHPLWDLHYVLYCLPGAALLVASLPPVLAPVVTAGVVRPLAGLAGRTARRPLTPRVGRLGAVVVVLLFAVLGLAQQRVYRDADTGHAENLRGVAAYLRANEAPGDGIVYSTGELRTLADVYPATFAELDDVALAHDALASATLAGVEIAPDALASALRRSTRVWLIRSHSGLPDPTDGIEGAKLSALATTFRLVSTAAISTLEVSLYVPR